MAYALKPGESIERSVRKIAASLLNRALRDLAERDLHEAHHRIRKGCKKMRGLLRLVRSCLGDSFAVENQWYRDFARGLAGVRDAQAVIESWTRLARADEANLPQPLRDQVLRALEQRRDRLTAAMAPVPGDLREQIELARQRSRRWRLDSEGFEAIGPGLRRGYRRARKSMRCARSQPSAQSLHRWRRRAKDHWYHMRLIDGLWPPELRARTRALGQLTDDLGQHHDLDVLRAALREIDLTSADHQILDERIETAARRLADAALEKGTHLFAARPKHFVARVRAHHEAWHTAPATQATPGQSK